MSINYSGDIVAQLHFQTVTGTSGVGFKRLKFHFRCQVMGWKDRKYVVKNINAHVSAGTTAKESKLLGTAPPERPIVIQTSSDFHEHAVAFDLDLLPTQIEAFEEVRKGQDLIFTFELKGEGYRDSQCWDAWDHIEMPVNQKAWIEVLRQIEYAEVLLFEVPMPTSKAPAELQHATASLKKAHDHFLAGNYDEAVASCRKTLEGIEKGLKEETAQKEAVKRYLSKKRDMSKIERQLFLREALEHYTHLAHHTSETGANFRFERSEARMVMGVTAALISLAMQQNVGWRSEAEPIRTPQE